MGRIIRKLSTVTMVFSISLFLIQSNAAQENILNTGNVLETDAAGDERVLKESEHSIVSIDETPEDIKNLLENNAESEELKTESALEGKNGGETQGNSEFKEDESEGEPDIRIEIEEDEERARVEPISKFNIVQISGYDTLGNEIVEKFPTSQNSIDRTSFTAENTYKREGLVIALRRRGSNGNIYEKSSDCSMATWGAPYDIIYDNYGGLLEFTYKNKITITNPDISQLHIQFVVNTTRPNGGARQIIRDIFIPLEDERAGAPQTPEIIYRNDYPDSYILTGVDSSMEYTIISDPYIRNALTWEPCPEKEIFLTPEQQGKICLVRYKAGDGTSESQYKELKIPVRKGAPQVSYNRNTEILSGLTTEMEYSIGEGEYTTVTEEIVSGDMSKIIDAIESDSIDLKVRYRSDNAPAGIEKVITLYKRLAPPSEVTFNLVTFTLEGTKSGMEYKTDEMENWKSITSASVNLKNNVSEEKDVTVQVRYKATNTNAYSKSITFVIPKLTAAPRGLSINYQTETIAGFDATKVYEYARSLTGSYQDIVLSDSGEFALGSLISSSPRTIYIREKATQEHPFSASAKIEIPGRKVLPSTIKFVYNDESVPETQARLVGVGPTMEYRQRNETEWLPLTGDSLIVDIPENNTSYYIREKATESEFVSKEYSLTLRTYYSQVGCIVNFNTEEIASLQNTMEYRIDGGEFVQVGDMKVISLSEFADSLSADETCMIDIRYMRREGYPVGKIKKFVIHSRPAAPSNLNYDPTTFVLSGVSSDMQYREVGETSWRTISNHTLNLKNLVNGRPDVKIEIRYKSAKPSDDDYVFASDITVFELY